jgi:hypothetical protein
MDEARSDQPDDRNDLWRETLASLALIGSALVLVFLIAQLGRL